MRVAKFLSFFFLTTSLIHAAPDALRVVPVPRTPEPENVETHLIFPENGAVKTRSPLEIQVRLEGFPLGTISDFPRKNEIATSRQGQTLHIFVDNEPFFTVNRAQNDSWDEDEDYFEQMISTTFPYELDPGMHLLRIFPARSWGESLKGDEVFAVSKFYYQGKWDDTRYDLRKPYLTYNMPQGTYIYSPVKPILLDFYVTNCELSRDGYKIRLSIDGMGQRVLTEWVPYYIYGLKPGTHNVRLELLDSYDKPVRGPLNDVERTITIE